MPVIVVRTNIKVEDPKPLMLELSQLGAELLGKPAEYMAIELVYNEHICFAGSFDPTYIATVFSVENFGPTENIELSKRFFEFLAKKLGIPDTRAYIAFQDVGTDNVGYRSTTLEELLKIKRKNDAAKAASA